MTRVIVFIVDKNRLKVEVGWADKDLFKPGRDVFFAHLKGEMALVRWGSFDPKSGFAGFPSREDAKAFTKVNSGKPLAQTSKK